MSKINPPIGPTEQEVREHFGDKLSPDVKLMRPPYTSIWALEDGTLLWDWRNGFSDAMPKSTHPINNLKCVVYITGKKGSGKSTFARLMPNAIKINLNTVHSRLEGNILNKINDSCIAEAVIFSSNKHSDSALAHIKSITQELDVQFININLTNK